MTGRSSDRGLSPVVGVAVLVAIVVVLGAVMSALAFGLVGRPAVAPEVRLALHERPCTHVLVHTAGDRMNGDRTEIRGATDRRALAGRPFRAGDQAVLDLTANTVQVVWRAQSGGEAYVVEEFDVADGGSGGGSWCSGGVAHTALSGTINAANGDGGSVTSLSSTADAEALGPALRDINGDGRPDLPFVNSSGTIKLTDSTNATTTVADSGDISGNIETSKTRLGVGSWDGSGSSVFFVDENHDTIYRSTPGRSVTTVDTPGNGAQAISGVGDIDADGTDELVFADGSQQLRYLEPGGGTKQVDNGQTGSNNGIGTGTLADFDGDGVASVAAVDGSNDIKITGEPTSTGGEGTTIVSAADAKKAPPTVADVDDDGTDELVYVSTGGKIKYVDDVRNGNNIRFLTDSSGSKIDGSGESGVV